MSPRSARVAWVVFLTSMAMYGIGLVYSWLVRDQTGGSDWAGHGGLLENAVLTAALASFSVVGLLIATRRPGNRIAWVMLATGFAWALPSAVGGYTTYGYAIRALPWQLPLLAVGQPVWIPAVGLPATFGIFLFPDGHLPSPRWRWLGWLSAIAIVAATIGTWFSSSPLVTNGTPKTVPNPLAVPPFSTLLAPLGAFVFALLICMIASAVSLLMRLRRAHGEVRAQLRWLAYAAVVVGTVYAVIVILSTAMPDTPGWLGVLQFSALSVFGLIPVSIGFAVLKYRLYDIDVVISKTVVFGALAAFITVVYVAVVVGIGTLLGDPTDPVLSVGATIAIALLFAPVRARVRRFANRLVYGERATPYEVMAGFSKRVAGTLSVEEVLPGMAEAAATGVGARVAQVRVLATEGERVVRWPLDAEAPASWDRSLEVRHQGDTVGGIDVAKDATDPLTAAEARLLEDLASQAGLALHNVRLADELALRTAELAQQTERLAASRQRLVAARDEQRRRLEREISEGPAARLRGIGHDLERARRLTAEDPTRAAELLDRLGERSNATLEALRDLARGIFPPLLVDKGVVAALEAHIRKVGADAWVEASPAFSERRFDADVEACLYFCCLQAIQNVLRHAGNAPTIVRLDASEEGVTFEVADEGPGFDPQTTLEGAGRAIIRDRVEALDGVLDVRTERGRGTVVAGRLPWQAVPA
ncbi:MAG: sensor histidine kinase [Actinomycetota bacterium]